MTVPARAEEVRFTASFLWMCQGYYRHSEGYTPEWSGMETFKSRIVHPQTWPKELDYTGKKVVVIGSGATGGDADPGRCRLLPPAPPKTCRADLTK
jgi:cation diffusion facilitator CzcD-associated flavoprotein CzcO